jgi:hypothetical protein
MKSWRLDPILGENVKRKDSEEYSDFSLQVERAALRSNGAIQVTYQLWNEQPHLTRSCAPSIKKELAEACQDILAVASDLDPVDLSRVLAKLEVDAGQQEPRSRADAADEAPREQLSLSPPGFVCVAMDEEGRSVYVVRNDGGGLEVVPSVVGAYKGEQVTHVPPRDLPWALPRAAAILEHYEHAGDEGWAASLLVDLETWHRKASELGRDEAYLLLGLYAMSTYVPEFCDYYAELLMKSDAERGKTRTGQAAIYVCRHGHHVIGIREASLLRDADHRQSALFIDLKDLWAKAERNNCDDIILGRFEKGAQVERVLDPDVGPHADTTFFNVFGPTILATNKNIEDILETRVLVVDMPLSGRRFNGRLPREVALPLVERLMAWRAVMLDRGSLEDSDPPADGRLGDVLRPLRQVLLTVDRRRLRAFDKVVTWQVQRRSDKLAQSWEARVVEAVWDCRGSVQSGWLVLDTVLTLYNGRLPEGKQASHRWLGGKLRDLGLTVERRGHDNVTSVEWSDGQMQHLRQRYGLVPQGAADDPQRTAQNVSHVSQVSHGGDSAREASCNASPASSNVSHNVSHKCCARTVRRRNSAAGGCRSGRRRR